MSPDHLHTIIRSTGMIGSPFTRYPTDDAMHSSINRASVPHTEGGNAPAVNPSLSPAAGVAAAFNRSACMTMGRAFR